MRQYSFCEGTSASGSSPWHIRILTEAGPKYGGGVDTASLCGVVRIRYGWDLKTPVKHEYVTSLHVCRTCTFRYLQNFNCGEDMFERVRRGELTPAEGADIMAAVRQKTRGVWWKPWTWFGG